MLNRWNAILPGKFIFIVIHNSLQAADSLSTNIAQQNKNENTGIPGPPPVHQRNTSGPSAGNRQQIFLHGSANSVPGFGVNKQTGYLQKYLGFIQ
jgi:hypothetical protein